MVELLMPRFFKVMFGDFEQRLKIPQAFSDYLSTKSSENVILKGPSGSRWHVGVKRTMNGIHLEEGWGEFSRAHCLTVGEFLLFTYDGNKTFSVQIFGTSTVERGNAKIVTQEVTNCEGQKRHVRQWKAQALNHVGSVSTGPGLFNFTQKEKNNQGSCLLGKFKQVQIDQSDSDSDKPVTLENVGAAKVVQTSEFEDISFTVTLQSSYEYYLPIPLEFANKYIGRGVKKVTLAVSDGRTWDVSYIVYGMKQCRLRSGWVTFRREMNLNDGDVCIFKMIRRNNVVFKVSISRSS